MDPIPSQLGRFPVRSELGRGGMGVVYLGIDPKLDRPVAMKVLPEEFIHDPDRLSRFEREAKVLAALSHPNIAVIHSLEEAEDGARFLVLEFVEGKNLAEVLRGEGVAPEEALKICAQIARALEAAHSRGVVHRDLKPENVKITPEGHVKVLDFGLARWEEVQAVADGMTSEIATSAMETEAGAVMGTAGYMSPEQARGWPQDRRTDIFSFGCVLYECLTGKKAFTGWTAADRIAAVLMKEPDYSLLPDTASGKLRELLIRCLEKDPALRLAEVRDARVVLEAALGERPSVPIPAPALTATPSNLPRQLTSFVGRDREMSEAMRLMRSTSLLTLTGVGGCGKTRLALQIAGELLAEHPGGVWLVELAPLSDPSLVPAAAAKPLGLRETPGLTLTQSIVRHFENKTALIILDNCEHLLESCAALAQELLQGCPDVKILATSREGLGISGETTWRVPSLPQPPAALADAREGVAPWEIQQFEAVELFVERARSVKPGFELTASNAQAVARITRRLDGIPLAIELAAARTRVLAAEQIDQKLDDRFRLLTGGSRSSLERHQTLRAAIDWSYSLLDENEKRCLRFLSAFAGGWRLAAAAAVCDPDEDEFAVLDLLTHLVDKSLVTVEEGDEEPRYHLLESVRQFAKEEMLRAGEAGEVGSRHCDVFLALARQADDKLRGPEQAEWLRRLEVEHENLVTAARWCAPGGGPDERGLELCTHIWWFWYLRGHFAVGRSVLEQALCCEGVAALSPLRSAALSAAGVLAAMQGDYPAARFLQNESLQISRTLEDRHGIARALNNLGLLASQRGDHAAAHALHLESLDLRRQLGDPAAVAASLNNLGMVAYSRGDFAAARAFYEESLPIQGELGNRSGVAVVLGNLGLAAHRQGDYAGARAFYEESLTLHWELGNKAGMAQVQNFLGTVAYAQGDNATARRCFEQSLELRRDLGDRQGTADSLNNLGDIALSLGNCDEARELFEQSLSIYRDLENRSGQATALGNLGLVAQADGNLAAARTLIRQSLVLRQVLGVRQGVVGSLEAVASLAGASGDRPSSIRFTSAAARLRSEMGMPRRSPDGVDLEVVGAEESDGERDGDAQTLWDEGQSLDWEAALEAALAWLEPPHPAA